MKVLGREYGLGRFLRRSWEGSGARTGVLGRDEGLKDGAGEVEILGEGPTE